MNPQIINTLSLTRFICMFVFTHCFVHPHRSCQYHLPTTVGSSFPDNKKLKRKVKYEKAGNRLLKLLEPIAAKELVKFGRVL